MEWRKLTSRQEIGCLTYFSSNLMRVWRGRVSTESLQLCVRLSSLLPLVPIYFLSLHVALQSNKPCQDSEAGMGPWKCSHYCTSQFPMGCIGDQTLWWNRILVGASLIGSVNHYKVIPRAVALEQSLEMTFCCLGTFPERVHLRVSRCCSAQIGGGQHLGGLKHAGFSPGWTDRFLPTLDAWLTMAGHPQQYPAPRVDVLVWSHPFACDLDLVTCFFFSNCGKLHITGSFQVVHWPENLPAVQEMRVRSLGWEDPLEEGMATHSSILAWKIPWTEEPGRLHTVHRVTQSRMLPMHFSMHTHMRSRLK